MKVLVAYATRHGATRGIAERVAFTLQGHGLETVLLPADEVRDVAPFDAFVIGSAAYRHRWLAPAATLVRANTTVLASRPTWLFSSGPLGGAAVKPGSDPLRDSIPKEFGEFERAIHPRDARVFFGAYDPGAPAVTFEDRFMTGFMKLFPQVGKEIPSGDYRDWPAIEAWAHGIAAELAGRPAPEPVTG